VAAWAYGLPAFAGSGLAFKACRHLPGGLCVGLMQGRWRPVLRLAGIDGPVAAWVARLAGRRRAAR